MIGRGGIDDPGDFCDFGCGEATKLGVAADGRFIFCQIDTKGFVGSDVGFLPLDIRGELIESLIGASGGFAQLLRLQSSDLGDFAFDDEFLHCILLDDATNCFYPFKVGEKGACGKMADLPFYMGICAIRNEARND